MSAIQQFAKSGVWDHKNIIVPLAAGIPLAIEGAILTKNLIQNPHILKEKWTSLKNKLIESFTVQPEETRREGILRIAKNSLALASCLALMATAAYFSVILLPSALAITSAISVIFLIGKLFANAKEYKKQLVAAFTAQEGEDPEVAKKRIRKNILKAAALVLVTAATVGIGSFVIAPMIAHGFSWSVALPLQTKGVVFAEYASVGALHGTLAVYQWKKGNRGEAIYHLFAAALSFVFPAFYWNNQMRLHHSFYGLLLMAAPSRPLRALGGMVTLDSALYMLAPLRGYASVDAWGDTQFNQYDFINTIVDNYALYAGTYAGALMLENINESMRSPSLAALREGSDAPSGLPPQSPALKAAECAADPSPTPLAASERVREMPAALREGTS